MAKPNSTAPAQTAFTPAQLIGSALFVVFVMALGAFYLFADFRGLTSHQGIDQAQIAREISRGHGFNTKFLRPFALYQARQKADLAGETVNLDKFEDTYHAPLGPLVNAAALKIAEKRLVLDKENVLYPGDRIIATTAVILLLGAVLVFYLLCSRIFDRKIGLVVVTLLVLCDLVWRFTCTGLPTALLLLLFGFALFFLYKGVEAQEMKQSPMIWAVLSAAFFGLMALSHWITVWIFLGALVYAALAFRPRGMVAAAMLLVFTVVITPGLVRNYIVSGSIHGDAFYALYNGLGALGEGGAMRNFKPDKETLNLQGFGGRIATTSVDQLKNLIGYFGSILAAPIFFVSLLHPFRRPEIGSFRWAILLMWVLALVGMSIFGLPDGELDSNQMHILFAPVMAAYGLAMVAILWNRMAASATGSLARNIPFILLILVSSTTMVVNIPRVLFRQGVFMDFPNYRPYLPKAFVFLHDWTNEREVIATDMPWGTAWYADRTSVWLPKDSNQFDAMVEFFDTKRTPVGGIYLSPVSTNKPLASGIMEGDNADWAYWILKPQFEYAAMKTQRKEANFRYGIYNGMGREMGFWSNFDRVRSGRPTETDIKTEPASSRPRTPGPASPAPSAPTPAPAPPSPGRTEVMPTTNLPQPGREPAADAPAANPTK